MTISYAFYDAARTTVTRTDSGSDPVAVRNIPWDVATGKPLDINGLAGEIWVADGSPTPTAFVPDLVDYAYAKMHAVLATGQNFTVASGVTVLCDGTTMTRADLALLALFGQQNPTGNKTWVDNNNVSTTLTGAEFVTLANLAMGWVADCYAAIGTLLMNIAGGSVTTIAQIDAVVWPTS